MNVSVIVNCHDEGLLLGSALESALRSIAASGMAAKCELICVVDKASGTTKRVLSTYEAHINHVVATDFGDLGLARNAGVETASGELVLFLDGDDLWGRNWIKAAWADYDLLPPETLLHPQCCVFFGKQVEVLIHPDWRDGYFDPRSLAVRNCWTSLCGLRRTLALDIPFAAVDHGGSFGFEDWSWYRRTVANGVVHAVIPRTVHFIRLKEGRSLRKEVAHYYCIPSLEFADYLAADYPSRPHDL